MLFKVKDLPIKFFHTYCPDNPPLLLALSGGPDSTALFYLLNEIRYPFEVAHVDHGWRKESGIEANYLKRLCLEKGVIFHLKELPPEDGRNLEEKGREARLEFFKEIVCKRGLHGVLLAHQADDHAETVLKRLFEGASLPKLRGLQPKCEVNGLLLYRPLLGIKKQEILKWLKESGISYFQDPTNEDPRFLRSRIRQDLIPTLSQYFGKEIAGNLCKLGEAASELDVFLKELAQPYLDQIQTTPDSIMIDFNQFQLPSLYLQKVIIRLFFESERITLPVSVLQTILFHLQNRSCHKSLRIGKQEICIHRNCLIFKRKCIQ